MLSFLTQGYHQCINSRLPTFLFFFFFFLIIIIIVVIIIISIHCTFQVGCPQIDSGRVCAQLRLNLITLGGGKIEPVINQEQMTVHRDETKLRLRGSMPPYSPPPPPSPRLAFEKFTFSIYIYTQNFTFVPKIIYFTPSLKKFTS